jgi:hypothetical protein
LAAARRKRRLKQSSNSYDDDSDTELDTLAQDVANVEQERMHEEIMARLRDEIGLHTLLFLKILTFANITVRDSFNCLIFQC